MRNLLLRIAVVAGLAAIVVAAVASRYPMPATDAVVRCVFITVVGAVAFFLTVFFAVSIMRGSIDAADSIHAWLYPKPSHCGSLGWFTEWLISIAITVIAAVLIFAFGILKHFVLKI